VSLPPPPPETISNFTNLDESLPPPPSPDFGNSLDEIEEADFAPPSPLNSIQDQDKDEIHFQESEEIEAGVKEDTQHKTSKEIKKFKLNKVQYQELKDSQEHRGTHRYIQNQKGKDSLVFDDFLFYSECKRSTCTWYHCSRENSGCGARLKVWQNIPADHEFHYKNGWITVSRDDHFMHQPQMQDIKNKEEKANLKQIAVIDKEKSARSIAASRVNLPHDMILTGPDEANLALSLRRVRRDPTQIIPNQQTRKFVLPDAFKVNNKGEPWILGDTGAEDPERIIIISSPTLQEQMTKSDFFLIDGTFSMCPSIYYQVMTIHAICAEVGEEGKKKL
jgi:hypothetical protein